MARILSAAQTAAIAGKRRREFWRVLTTDPDGAQADLSALAGHNWIEGGDIDDNIDQPIAGATIRLRRDHGALSLSPLRTDSTLNRDAAAAYAPFLDVGRWIAVECQVVDPAVSAVPVAGDWIRVFEGSIDSIDPGDKTLVMVARDKGAALEDSWLATPTAAVVAGDTPVPVEEVIQGMLDTALGAGNVTLYTPVSPLYESTRFGYQRETTLSAIQRLVESFGWSCRYRWDAGTSSFRLTLYQPPRDKAVPDITLSRYRSLKKFAVSRTNIRNTVRVYYSDPIGGRHSVFHNDAASQARYGTRPIIIEEASDSTISSDVEADAMALALLADLKDPGSDGECDSPLLPHVELDDLVRLPPNAIHFDTNQDLAVVGVRHSFSKDGSSTVLTLRGRPAGAYRSWLRRGGPPIQGGGVSTLIEPPSCWFESSNQSGLFETVTFNGRPGHNAPASPFMWHTRTTVRGAVGDWTPWSEAALPIAIDIVRDPKFATQLEGEVLQADGQTWHDSWSNAAELPGLDPTTGTVDPTQPLAGTSHFIPRATDVGGMQMDPGTKDSRTAPLNGMFRYGTDTAVGVMETAGLGFTNPGYLDGSRRPVALRDGTLGADVGAAALNDGRLRAVSAIDPAQNGLLLAAAKDSRSAPLNAMGRTGVDSIASWLDGGGFSKVSSSDMSGNRVAVLHVGDTRNTNAPPSGYSQGVTNEFKDAGAIGIPGFAPSSGVFGNLRTEKPWSDSSGGYATQTWAGSDGRVWKREAAAGGASWPNPWRIITETQTQRIDRSTGHADSTMQDARSFPLNQMGRLGTDTLDNWLDGTYKKPTVAQVGYADRAGVGLDSSGYVQSGVRTAATVAGLSAALLSRRSGALFVETYDVLPQNNGWAISGVGGWSAVLQSDTNSTMGRNCLITTNYTVQSWGTPIPINPNKLYRLRARVRTIQYHAEGAANTVWYIGVIASDYAGNAANANSGACYCVAESANPGLGGFVEYVGWMKGCTTPYATTAGLAGGTAAAPAAWNVGTVAIQPYILAGYPNGGAGIGGQFMVDYFLIDEFDEDGTMRTYSTIEQGGANPLLKSNVKQYDGITSRVIAKGHSTGTARFPGSRILFPENYQNPPLVLLRGGLLSEPRAKWGPLGNGSETGAFNAALPVYEDLVALNLDASGFDLRARLRQKSGSTARSDNFPAGNSLSGLGATTQATLANAPANNDTYTANYTVSGTLTPFPGGSASLDVIVALDTSNDSGGTWQTRATKAYSIRAFGSPRTISWNAETMVAVAQLQAPGARVRLRIDTVDWTDDSGGTMSLAVHGRSGGGDGSGVTYNTSVDNFASKTPDAEDLITWEAIEVS